MLNDLLEKADGHQMSFTWKTMKKKKSTGTTTLHMEKVRKTITLVKKMIQKYNFLCNFVVWETDHSKHKDFTVVATILSSPNVTTGSLRLQEKPCSTYQTTQCLVLSPENAISIRSEERLLLA